MKFSRRIERKFEDHFFFSTKKHDNEDKENKEKKKTRRAVRKFPCLTEIHFNLPDCH